MKDRRHRAERARDRLPAERRGDVPMVAERIGDEARALAIRTIGWFAERRCARCNRALERRVGVVHEHVKCHRPDRHAAAACVPFANDDHRVADTHFAVHAAAAPASAERFPCVEHLREEIDQPRLAHPDVRSHRREPLSNGCRHCCHARSPFELRPEARLELRAGVMAQIRGNAGERRQLGIAQRVSRIAARDDGVHGLVQAIGEGAFSHGHPCSFAGSPARGVGAA